MWLLLVASAGASLSVGRSARVYRIGDARVARAGQSRQILPKNVNVTVNVNVNDLQLFLGDWGPISLFFLWLGCLLAARVHRCGESSGTE